jgi:arsenite methyltransferase
MPGNKEYADFKFLMVLVLVCISFSGCRSIWQKPDEVIEAIALNDNDIIADIGAGRGYFSYRFADLENSGRVYAVEIDEKLLERMQRKADASYPGKLIPVLGSYEDPNIPEKVDVIFLCNTYHHIENRVGYFSNLGKYLNENGRIVIIEPDNLPWYLFTLRNHQTPAGQVIDEMAQAGYKLRDQSDFLPVQNFLIFGSED